MMGRSGPVTPTDLGRPAADVRSRQTRSLGLRAGFAITENYRWYREQFARYRRNEEMKVKAPVVPSATICGGTSAEGQILPEVALEGCTEVASSHHFTVSRKALHCNW